jgi:hypothetical protein
MSRLWPWLLLAALLTGACERLAGTEVGNPEVSVHARFAVMDSGSGSAVPEMHLKVMGLRFSMDGDTGEVWGEPDGHMVDIADTARQGLLPAVSVKDADWSRAELILQSPAADPALPDTASFGDWSHPRHAKLIKIAGADTLRFLFEMPAGMKFKLGFDQATVDSWRGDKSITLDVKFDGPKWADCVPDGTEFHYRMDGNQERYILLSPGENPEAYQAFADMLPKCFMADTMDMM